MGSEAVMGIVVVGLGPGDPGLLTRQGWDVLAAAAEVYLRTRIHPTVAHLPDGPRLHSFDDLYEQAVDFEQVYDAIVERLVGMARAGGEVVYAVPGDPMVAEGTVTRLLAVCREKQIAVRIVSGVSFIEPTLAALGVDAVPGLQLVDATDLAAAYHPPINPDSPALVVQVYSRQLASDVKLTLMNQYPDDHSVMLIHAAGTPDQVVDRLPLYEIDRRECAHLTSLYVPRLDANPAAVTGFEGFQNTIAHLRAPEGCPWDQEQTHQSLRKNLMEEAYEVIDAIDSGDARRLAEELGDLLLQVVLQTQIAIDEGEFHMAEVIRHIDAKLKRRHPHVWGEVDVNGDAQQVAVNWEQIKARERAENGQRERSALDGVPQALPALAQAHEYDSRAARLGFDWPDEQGVIDKVREELGEVLEARSADERFFEIGDLLFVVAVWARWMGINPEDALREANRRFYARFAYIEDKAREQGRPLTAMTLDEMNGLWDEFKARARGAKPGDTPHK
jgi:tetrapyrrole methylase family protein/MazG family protein